MKETIIKKLNSKHYTIKEQTASDIKKNRFFVTLKNNDKVVNIAQVVYSNKTEAYQLKANRKFEKATMHEGWAMSYARKFENADEVIKCIDELKNTYKTEFEAKKTAKTEKTEKKEAKTEKKEQKTEKTAKTEKKTEKTAKNKLIEKAVNANK